MLARHAHDGVEAPALVPGLGEAGCGLEGHRCILEELRRLDEPLQLVGDAPRVGKGPDPGVLVQRDLVLSRLLELQRRGARRGRPQVGDRPRARRLLLDAPRLLLDPGPDARRLGRISRMLRRFGRARRISERDEQLHRALRVSGLGEADGSFGCELLLAVVQAPHERRPHSERLHHQVAGVRVPLHRGERPRGFRHAPRAKIGPHSRVDLPLLLEGARGREHLVSRVVAHASSGISAIARFRTSG